MSPRKFFLPLAAGAAVVLFVFALIHLLLLRYERGDVYPAYSTLRADPLGTRAYFEALDSMKAYDVSRGFTLLHGELQRKPAAMFYLGIETYELSMFSEDEVAALDEYVKNGGRVVLTFSPEEPRGFDFTEDKKTAAKKKADAKSSDKKTRTSPPTPATKSSPDDGGPPSKTQQEKQERDDLRQEREDGNDERTPKYHPSLAALWGFGWDTHKEDEEKKPAFDPSKPLPEKPEVLAKAADGTGLEPAVPWKSATYLVRIEPEWQTLYRAKGKPVMIRRAYGKGEIIVAADSYLVSNEALRNDRRPELLALLAGPGGRLLFDETHLGTQEQEGVMVLMKRFRLEGFLYGMLAVLLLFLWRNSVPLVPPHASVSHATLGGTVSGKDSRSGLVNLLRRNIPASDILRASFTEWKRGTTPGITHSRNKTGEMEAVLAAMPHGQPGRIVPTYHQLREINQPGRAKEHYGTKPGTTLTTAEVRPD